MTRACDNMFCKKNGLENGNPWSQMFSIRHVNNTFGHKNSEPFSIAVWFQCFSPQPFSKSYRQTVSAASVATVVHCRPHVVICFLLLNYLLLVFCLVFSRTS